MFGICRYYLNRGTLQAFERGKYMRKKFNGFKLEKVDLPEENIITASSSSLCYYSNNYEKAQPNTWQFEECFINMDTKPFIRDTYYWFASTN